MLFKNQRPTFAHNYQPFYYSLTQKGKQQFPPYLGILTLNIAFVKRQCFIRYKPKKRDIKHINLLIPIIPRFIILLQFHLTQNNVVFPILLFNDTSGNPQTLAVKRYYVHSLIFRCFNIISFVAVFSQMHPKTFNENLFYH